MDANIIKAKVQEYSKKNYLTVKEFLKKYDMPNDSSFDRMVKAGTFKLQTVERLADIIGTSIDELIGRSNFIKGSGERGDGQNYQILKDLQDRLAEKEHALRDKDKIITLLEGQIKNINIEYERKQINRQG